MNRHLNEFPDTTSGIKNVDRHFNRPARSLSDRAWLYIFLGFWLGMLTFLVGALLALGH